MTRAERRHALLAVLIALCGLLTALTHHTPVPHAAVTPRHVAVDASDLVTFDRRAHEHASRSLLRQRITRARMAYLAHQRLLAEQAAAARALAAQRAAAEQVAHAPVVTSTGGIPAVWLALAKCEAGGNWRENTGNGFYGAFQITASNAAAYGYGRPDLLPPESQLALARRVLASQGPGAWPVCGPRVGLQRGD